VGFLGGKTQTDLSTMDDLYLEGVPLENFFTCQLITSNLALGITDEVEALQLKGNKKKKAKKLDEDFIVSSISCTKGEISELCISAGDEAHHHQRGPQGCPGHEADDKQKGYA
jgi:hypothetical protein